uniref:Reverse transcriptase domain-containing protein n=1 Tax=Haemonchus contortus TaxID=6289 RepID=A0A7I4Z5W8_HAECO
MPHVDEVLYDARSRHAIKSKRNCTAPGPDRIKPELKGLPPVIVRTLARLFSRYLSECKVPTSWRTSETVLLYKKEDPDDIGFSTIDHIHTLTLFNEVSREYKMPLCLTFIDLKKIFDTVEIEAVIEVLGNQGVPS